MLEETSVCVLEKNNMYFAVKNGIHLNKSHTHSHILKVMC